VGSSHVERNKTPRNTSRKDRIKTMMTKKMGLGVEIAGGVLVSIGGVMAFDHVGIAVCILLGCASIFAGRLIRSRAIN
jgi:hypothetical protein